MHPEIADEWTKEWVIDWNVKQLGKIGDRDMRWLRDRVMPAAGIKDIRSPGAKLVPRTTKVRRATGLSQY